MNFPRYVAFGLTVLSAQSLWASQVRTVGWDCAGKKGQNSIHLTFKKAADYDTSQLSLSFSAEVTGSFDGQTGTLAGKWAGTVDPHKVSPVNFEYAYAGTDGNTVSIANLSHILNTPDKLPFPGWSLSMQVKTSDPSNQYLVIRGISGLDRTESGALTVKVYTTNGQKPLSLGQVSLVCKSQFSE